MKNINRILLSVMLIPILLTPVKTFALGTATDYKVKNGDSLWKIATANKLTVDYLKGLNNLNTDYLNIGQVIKLLPNTITHTVQQGDTLYLLAKKFGSTIETIKKINNLTETNLSLKQKLFIPYTVEMTKNYSSIQVPAPVTVAPTTPEVKSNTVQSVKGVSLITYVVQAGSTASSIAKKFNVSATDIMKFNYMGVNDWFNEGQKISINDYAPRDYAVTPGTDKSPTQYGKVVDWFRDGQYLLKRNDIFTIVDFSTRKQFSVIVMGGFNHCDIEPLTASDTAIMKSLFGTWNWAPRAVVIFNNGMSIAGSLSGMPHSFDTTATNGVNGHFDLYLKNSVPHGDVVSKSYVQQHYNNIPIASGENK